MFELAEEAFDEVALAIERGIDRALDFTIALGGDVSTTALCPDEIDHGLSVIATIGDQRLCGRQAVDQCFDGRLVGCLARREDDPERQPVLIDQRVDLGAQSATRTANGVIRAPFLPPAAC